MGLTVTELSCRRGDRRVFSGVTFCVPAGRAVLLTGPNGAGKSTLLRVIAGLVPADRGAVQFEGLRLADDPGVFQSRLVYAGHLDAVKPQFTVRENLAIWARIFGGGGVDDALVAFGLSRIADLPAAACSAGQKRRLGLARVMLTDRPLLLLDEPTVSLDAASIAAFAGLLRARLDRGGTALIATHAPLGLDNALEVALRPAAAARPPADDPFLGDAWT
ncbi:MAG: heme ABC exporter ATP-binding protein CcmA [Rubrimonas sp.]